jgi:hypothetical protein
MELLTMRELKARKTEVGLAPVRLLEVVVT